MNGDPRSIVTPDAFSVTPALLGTPLAEPWRRLVALLLDLVLIGFLQLLGWRVLGGIAGLMLLRMATKRTDGATTTRTQKFALGCAGAMVFVVAIGVTTVVPAMLRMMTEPDGEVAVPAAQGVVIGTPEGNAVPLDSESARNVDDSIATLLARVDDLEDDLADSRVEHEELREQLAEAESRSTLFTWIRDAADEAGLIFGWGTVYLTLFFALWQGRTPGKKAMGLRVVRLNGEPLGLYLSLERAGGYMAGLATGLLGFAQVWWDPNRQAIHDKIAETVVIRERMPNRLHPGSIYGEGVAERAGQRQDSSSADDVAGAGQDVAAATPEETGERQS
ncbi:MAG: RDD family protein [Gemmatimonadetes bacterium]|nr:RDD family protein [Gemmatimonadota bacterium]MCY3610259.1 RDD family protein [Gemmatimonadota bacterium]